jgi:hypothetical protein
MLSSSRDEDDNVSQKVASLSDVDLNRVVTKIENKEKMQYIERHVMMVNTTNDGATFLEVSSFHLQSFMMFQEKGTFWTIFFVQTR